MSLQQREIWVRRQPEWVMQKTKGAWEQIQRKGPKSHKFCILIWRQKWKRGLWLDECGSFVLKKGWKGSPGLWKDSDSYERLDVAQIESQSCYCASCLHVQVLVRFGHCVIPIWETFWVQVPPLIALIMTAAFQWSQSSSDRSEWFSVTQLRLHIRSHVSAAVFPPLSIHPHPVLTLWHHFLNHYCDNTRGWHSRDGLFCCRP